MTRTPRYCITIRNRRHFFPTEEAARAHAASIWERQGILVGIEMH